MLPPIQSSDCNYFGTSDSSGMMKLHSQLRHGVTGIMHLIM